MNKETANISFGSETVSWHQAGSGKGEASWFDKIPVDLVFTYVDGNQAHSEKRKYYENLDGNPQHTGKKADIRFRNVGEILFSVRSAIKYMPWLRRIFIVTDAQKPPVDNQLIESGQVRIIDHREFIPETYLPTFNSMTIESFLHRIDGLSEIFLYNNDDFMHFSDVSKSTFIRTASQENLNLELNAGFAITRRIMHLASRLLPSSSAALLANPYTTAISNAYKLLRESQYHLSWGNIIVPKHVTHIYRKKTMQRIDEEFADPLDTNRKFRFRVPDRFSYSTLVYSLEWKWNPGDQLRSPTFFRSPGDSTMFDFTAFFVHRKKLWRQVASSRAMFACLNNIPQTDKNDFERIMYEKGLGCPCDESQHDETTEAVGGK